MKLKMKSGNDSKIPTNIEFECTVCDQTLSAELSFAGLEIFCPTCGQKITVPVPPETPEDLIGSAAPAEGTIVIKTSPKFKLK